MFDPEAIQGRLRNRPPVTPPASPGPIVDPPPGVLPNSRIPQPRGNRHTPAPTGRGNRAIPPDQWNAMSRAQRRQIAQGSGGGARTPMGTPPPNTMFPTNPTPSGQTPPPGGMGGPGSYVSPAAPPAGGGSPPSSGGPPTGYQPWMSGQQGGGFGDAYSFTDPFQQFLSAVPVMNLNRDKQISDSMAEAGFGGNRYGTYAAGKAAEIGGQTALQEDALLWNTLSDYGNKTQDRALQANQLGLNAAQLQDQMAQNRLLTPFQIAQYEQGRQDQFSNTAFQDWSQNRMGWLGPLLQAAMSQGAGSPGQIYTTQTPSSPGAVDYMPLITGLLGLFGGGGG